MGVTRAKRIKAGAWKSPEGREWGDPLSACGTRTALSTNHLKNADEAERQGSKPKESALILRIFVAGPSG
jgi:hypothetical protein